MPSFPNSRPARRLCCRDVAHGCSHALPRIWAQASSFAESGGGFGLVRAELGWLQERGSHPNLVITSVRQGTQRVVGHQAFQVVTECFAAVEKLQSLDLAVNGKQCPNLALRYPA